MAISPKHYVNKDEFDTLFAAQLAATVEEDFAFSGRVIHGEIGAAGAYAVTFAPDTAGSGISHIVNTGSKTYLRSGSDPYSSYTDHVVFNLITGATEFMNEVVVNGKLEAVMPSGGNHIIHKNVSPDIGSTVLIAGQPGVNSFLIYAVSGTGENFSNAAVKIRKDGITNRSINAAGTLNASGADYAEYEKKSATCGDIAKGDIVGFNSDGELTDKFSEAVQFGIKSTDPGYVGGDTWGDMPERPEAPKEEDFTSISTILDGAGKPTSVFHAVAYDAAKIQFENDDAAWLAELEEKRQQYDRIAYSGKVPVNGTEGATVGDYIEPEQGAGDTIVARLTPLKSTNTLGRVKSIGADGRAIVRVIIA